MKMNVLRARRQLNGRAARLLTEYSPYSGLLRRQRLVQMILSRSYRHKLQIVPQG